MPPEVSKFAWGQRVRAAVDLDNDGSHPAGPAGSRLVDRGTAGEVIRIGQYVEAGVPVYLVEFGGTLVVGCCEDELDAV
jgi:nitrogen fixation protein NifZ